MPKENDWRRRRGSVAQRWFIPPMIWSSMNPRYEVTPEYRNGGRISLPCIGKCFAWRMP
jgi:hypothetical protein